MSGWRVARALSRSDSFTTPRSAAWTFGAVGLEATARALGWYDVRRCHSQFVWSVSDTTKHFIAEGVDDSGPRNVAVFRILDFHRQELEAGVRATRRLTRGAADYIKRAAGSDVQVSVPHGGTIIALLPGDREAAEATARDLIRGITQAPLARDG